VFGIIGIALGIGQNWQAVSMPGLQPELTERSELNSIAGVIMVIIGMVLVGIAKMSGGKYWPA
jgi:hypothetical protein